MAGVEKRGRDCREYRVGYEKESIPYSLRASSGLTGVALGHLRTGGHPRLSKMRRFTSLETYQSVREVLRAKNQPCLRTGTSREDWKFCE